MTAVDRHAFYGAIPELPAGAFRQDVMSVRGAPPNDRVYVWGWYRGFTGYPTGWLQVYDSRLSLLGNWTNFIYPAQSNVSCMAAWAPDRLALSHLPAKWPMPTGLTGAVSVITVAVSPVQAIGSVWTGGLEETFPGGLARGPDGSIYQGSADGWHIYGTRLWKLDKTTGAQLWWTNTGGAVVACSPALPPAPGRVYAGGAGSVLRVYDTAAGALVGQRTLGGPIRGIVSTGPAVYASTQLAAAPFGGRVEAFSPDLSEQRWSCNVTPGSGAPVGMLAVAPPGGDGPVYLAFFTRIYRITSAGVASIWIDLGFQNVVGMAFSSDGATLYAATAYYPTPYTSAADVVAINVSDAAILARAVCGSGSNGFAAGSLAVG